MCESKMLLHSTRYVRLPIRKVPGIEVSVCASDGNVVDVGMPQGGMDGGTHFHASHGL